LKKYKVEGQITSISEESQRQIIGAWEILQVKE
jgi:hypothetical protein